MQLPRLAGFAAIAAPLLMWSEFLTMGLLRPGYDLLTGAASDLATRGSSNAALFALGFFFIPGALTLLVGIGLWLTHPRGILWRLGALLVASAGLFLILTGAFPQDPASVVANAMHGAVSQTCFVFVTLATVALGTGAPSAIGAAPPRRTWLALAGAVVLIEAFNVLIRPELALPNGLFQRPFTFVLTIWFLVTGAWLLRRHPGRGSAG